MPLPTCDKSKSAFWGMYDPIVTLTLDLLTPKFEAFILAPKPLSGKSLVEFRKQICKISC